MNSDEKKDSKPKNDLVFLPPLLTPSFLSKMSPGVSSQAEGELNPFERSFSSNSKENLFSSYNFLPNSLPLSPVNSQPPSLSLTNSPTNSNSANNSMSGVTPNSNNMPSNLMDTPGLTSSPSSPSLSPTSSPFPTPLQKQKAATRPKRKIGVIESAEAGGQDSPGNAGTPKLPPPLDPFPAFSITTRSNSIDLLTAASEIERKTFSVPGSPNNAPGSPILSTANPSSGSSPSSFVSPALISSGNPSENHRNHLSNYPQNDGSGGGNMELSLQEQQMELPNGLNNHAPTTSNSNNNTSNPFFIASLSTTFFQSAQTFSNDLESQDGKMLTTTSDGFPAYVSPPPAEGGEKKRKSHKELLTDEEKRKKFLERNRKAAQKCRQKKKQAMDQLEKETQELERLYEQLAREIEMTKKHNSQLENFLKDHVRCSA